MSSTHDNTDSHAAPPAEPGKDSTVNDWHGQDVERDKDAADEALERADGDADKAEQIFEEERPAHEGDVFDVPAGEREGSLVEPDEG